jgi:hypothetical protein
MSSRGRLGKLYGARYPANWRALAGQVTRGRRRASSEAPRLGFLDERSLTLWLNPLQKQLVFRCNQIVHAEYPFIVHARPCAFPASVGTRHGCPVQLLLQLYEAPKTPAQPLVPLGRTCSGHPRLPGRCRSRVQDVGGRNKSGQGDLGLYRARYGTADFAQPDSHGSSTRVSVIISIIK